jgi:hypothetical protein
MTNHPKAIVQPRTVVAVAAVATGGLVLCLSVIVRLPFLISLAIAIVVGGGILVAARRPRREADATDVPITVTPASLRPQYQVRQVSAIPLPSAVPGFSFFFSATVYWLPAVDGVIEPERVAAGEIIRRAAEFTQQYDPGQALLVQNGLAEAVADARADPKRRVYARAGSVELTITADDQRHLDEREKLRKQEDLWDLRRRLELNKRKYLADDVLKSPASALVWWLARNDDKPEKVAENIEVLTRLADAADASGEASAGRARRFEAAGHGDNAAMATATPPPTTAERFDAFLDSFDFPGGDARLLLTKQVADWVEAHGFRAAAREMTSPYGAWPGEGDLASQDDGPGSADG